ncbi:MAG: ABC transporter ATP-binding protein [Planctomycetota bacterium]|nr:ABC transporter ATP-binding protein [Planctomycetota bacterium]
MAQHVIRAVGLNKKYGTFHAVKSLDLELDEGDVFGFIGPNGAGKTTTMRMLATLLDPTSGEAYVCGHSIYQRPREIRRLVGYMPDFFGVYDDMKVIEYLEFFAATYRIAPEKRIDICERVLDLVDLMFKRDNLANTLSRGQTQRLGLARVLVHDPQVLLLDEPASGLDPRARIKIRELIKRLRDMGKTIMVSSHILPELADICNKVGIIERGELIVNERVSEVMQRIRSAAVLRISVRNDLQRAAQLIEASPMVDRVETDHDGIKATLVAGEEDYSALAKQLVDAGFALQRFQEEEMNLETAFMHLTEGVSA